jgi:hypothetical protein
MLRGTENENTLDAGMIVITEMATVGSPDMVGLQNLLSQTHTKRTVVKPWLLGKSSTAKLAPSV